MKVSVILTTYNRPDALKKVLDGLMAQTCPPHEIIIADDGSGEATRSVIQPYLRSSRPRVAHVWQADKGFRAARSRNRAILAATGDYLVLLDGDCIPGAHFISDHMALAAPGTFFQGKRVLVNGKAQDSFSFKDTASFFRLAGLALRRGLSNSHHIFRIPFFPSHGKKGLSGVRSCNMGLFRKDAIAVNGFNQAFEGWGREDTEFVIRLFRFGLKRRENPFRAICFHLWHHENPRDHLEKNDRLLAAVKAQSGYFCADGLDSLTQDREANQDKQMSKVSAYIIAFNEAEKIKDALKSVAWADEIVVADSYSTDDTAKIAEAHGARVVQIEFQGFGNLRNDAIAACSHDWIFSLDSDERCTRAAREEIRSIINDPESLDAYYVPRKNFFMGRWIRHAGFYPDFRQPQLFRKGTLRFMPDAVHERYEVVSDRPCGYFKSHVHQIPYKDLEEIIHKANRYSTLGAEKLAKSNKRPGMLKALTHGIWAAFTLYILKLGVLDGWPGFIIALGNFEGTFYKYAKFYLKEKGMDRFLDFERPEE